MKLEHVGIAVADAEKAAASLERVLGMIPYKTETVVDEAVRTVFLDAGGPRLELLEATTEGSVIARHIERRGEGMHHLAFEVDDIGETHARLVEAGVRVLNEAPKHGADEKLIFFIHPRETAGVLVELCQSSSREWTPSHIIKDLAVFERGQKDAPPLVLIHGAMGSTTLETRHLHAALEPHFRLLALDLSGHGESRNRLKGTPTIDDFVDDVIEVMDEMEITKASVLGFSMGAGVALRLASLHPERVDRIISHATNVKWNVEEVKPMIHLLDPDVIDRKAPYRRQRLEEVHGADHWRDLARSLIEFVKTLPETHMPDDDLAAIEAPVLISHGDRDRLFGLQHPLHLRNTIPSAQLIVHPGMAHRLTPFSAETLGTAAARFLRQ